MIIPRIIFACNILALLYVLYFLDHSDLLVTSSTRGGCTTDWEKVYERLYRLVQYGQFAIRFHLKTAAMFHSKKARKMKIKK